MPNPKPGASALCRMCGEEIIYIGPAWSHLGAAQPRHPALPQDAEPAAVPTLNPYAPAFPLLMPRDPADGVIFVGFMIDLPAGMCPASGNPAAGSTLYLCPQTTAYPEVYAVSGCANEAAQELVGGFAGDEGRPPVRSMEGAVAHIARAVAALLGVPVVYSADLAINVRGQVRMHIDGKVQP